MASLDLSVISKSWKADLTHLDPVEFLPRLVALFLDPRIRGRYYVNSAARSYIHQAALFRGWMLRLPGFNPANPPGSSQHEYGLPSRAFAFAVDINIVQGKGGTWAELHIVAREYGFHFPFANRRTNPENWHAELAPNRRPLPKPTPAPMPQEDEDDMAVLGKLYEWDDGAIATVNKKGEVFCHELPNRPTAKHYGGMTQLRDDAKKAYTGDPYLVGINPANSQAGYVVLDNGAKFIFEESARKFFK